MADDMLHVIPTALDLLALATCLGTLGCRLWVLPALAAVPGAIGVEAIRVSLWRLLVSCIAALTISSLAELVGRAAEMSGQPLSAILPVLPTVLFQTHYGWVWLMRPIALTTLWLAWWMGRSAPRSRRIPAVMFGAGALIAMTRSASGHAADWGDLTLPEIIDWVHLMASSLWGGGLVALSVAVLPAAFKLPVRRRQCIAAAAQRFSILAGVTLAGVLLTGLYNAWRQLGTIADIWRVPYGRMLLVKLLLVIPLVALGASNHYTSVPLLQGRTGRPDSRRPLPRILVVIQRCAPGQGRRRAVRLVRRFTRKVWVEVLFVMGILICTAFLLHGTPARHAMHREHSLIQPEVPGHDALHNMPWRQGLPRRDATAAVLGTSLFDPWHLFFGQEASIREIFEMVLQDDRRPTLVEPAMAAGGGPPSCDAVSTWMPSPSGRGLGRAWERGLEAVAETSSDAGRARREHESVHSEAVPAVRVQLWVSMLSGYRVGVHRGVGQCRAERRR